MKQNELAARVGVSASYLNLIERNKRPISGALLARIAGELSLPFEQMDGRAERRLRDDLAEIAAEPDIAMEGEGMDAADEFIARFPAWARAAGGLHRLWRGAREEAEAMADRLTHDPALGAAVHEMLTEITALRSTAEILNEGRALSPSQRRRFEQIMFEQSSRLAVTGAGLAAYFDDAAEARRRPSPIGAAEEALTRARNLAEEIEKLANAARKALGGDDLEAACRRRTPRPPETPPEAGRAERLFLHAHAHAAQAHRRALLTLAETIAPPENNPDEIILLIEAELALRLADALIAPAAHFSDLGAALEWDIEKLTRAYDGDSALIMRRIACLAGHGAPRAAHVAVDASGHILSRRGALELLPGGRRLDCPVWPVHRAGRGEPFARLLETTDGERVFAIAALNHEGMTADMLVMAPDAAKTTAYAPALARKAEAAGPDCRICAHAHCPWRREPAVIG